MTKVEFGIARKEANNNKRLKPGLDLFEKYVGRIEWLHEDGKSDVKSEKKYAVLNTDGDIVYESNTLNAIAKEYGVSISRISACINLDGLLQEKYKIVRCKHE